MKTSRIWNFRSIVGNIMMGLVLAAMICSIEVAPALGKDDKGRYEDKGRGNYNNGRYGHRKRVYRRHDNRKRVYVSPPAIYVPLPPPVIFVPPPPPGIHIFFPPIFFHR